MDLGVTVEALKVAGAAAGLALAVLKLADWRTSRRPRPQFEGLNLKNGELARAIQQAKREAETREVLLNLARNVHSLELRQIAFEAEIKDGLRRAQFRVSP